MFLSDVSRLNTISSSWRYHVSFVCVNAQVHVERTREREWRDRWERREEEKEGEEKSREKERKREKSRERWFEDAEEWKRVNGDAVVKERRNAVRSQHQSETRWWVVWSCSRAHMPNARRLPSVRLMITATVCTSTNERISPKCFEFVTVLTAFLYRHDVSHYVRHLTWMKFAHLFVDFF